MVFISLLFAGCGADSADGILDLEASPAWTAEGLAVDARIRFEPTTPMREALERGVDLYLDITTRVFREFGPVPIDRRTQRHEIRIRFLPLTEQWQMSIGDEHENYPRLWLLLDALERPRQYATGLETDSTTGQDWRVQVRARFDPARLPAPMHLPSLFSSQWRLATPWLTWPIDRS